MRIKNIQTTIRIALSLYVAALCAYAEQPAKVDFHAQILPILDKHCMQCHNRDAHKGGLGLGSAEEALKGGDSGVAAYRPGNGEESAIIQRVTSTDPGFRMPSKGDPLSAEEIALLKAWIDEGASWGGESTGKIVAPIGKDFWSFQKPIQAPLPAVKRTDWPRNPIDTFALAKMEEHNLAPSPEADRYTLIRRASLDLTGLPPTIEDIESFVNDPDPNAYEKLIDRLLASPHYGEAQAMRWMDAARYADTNGYEKDRPRSVWPYRDWAIKAFNANMPYDQFVIEQLAGDLLPDANTDDRIATGFHRNTMLNEEGGIDVEEFRYEAMVDRTNTTGQVFLGLTFGCAQCHTHKYDPITHDEYFQFYAFLNNTDDVAIDVPDDSIATKRTETRQQIDTLVANLPNKFPVAAKQTELVSLKPTAVASTGGASLAIDEQGVVAASGNAPDTDTYRIEVEAQGGPITVIRIDTAPNTGDIGAGRSDKGNFVLSEIAATLEKTGGDPVPLTFAHATSDVAYNGYEPEKAIDGNKQTGWAVDAPGIDKAAPHALTLYLKEPLVLDSPARIVLTLDQQYGRAHTLARFNVNVVREFIPASDEPDDVRRAKYLDERFAAWDKETSAKAREWTTLEPVRCESKFHASFRMLDDHSILAHGDNPNTDTYTAEFRSELKNITAIRIEVLTDPSLPGNGPGRGEIMSQPGDFLLSEVKASAAPWNAPDQLTDVMLQNPSADFAAGGRTPALTLDDKLDSGWSINGAQGAPHAIVFELASPIAHDSGTLLKLVLDQYYVHYHTIGRFRVSVTSDPLPVGASGVPEEIESILVKSVRTGEEIAALKNYYVTIAPELADAQKQIADLRKSMPTFAKAQVLLERETPRVARVFHRGEFLNPKDPVEPGVLAVLPPLQPGVPLTRLTLAKWIVSKENPLTARVMINRLWHTYFGRGIVASVEDFGSRGDLPTHPELLDWLAVEFMRRDWNIKDMTRMLVTSATYRQRSNTTPDLLAADPTNEWFARAPRYRVEAEFVRDIALSASGLLSAKIGGPSMKPPLPDGALSLVYPGEGWTVAEGEDRYRRGMYVYWKRTLPYPASSMFDAPARDVAVVKRNRSNTPLQALTLLNDPVFVEAAQAFKKRIVGYSSDDTARIRYAFMLCVSRPPDDAETQAILNFLNAERAKLTAVTMEGDIALAADTSTDATTEKEIAAWVLVCRSLLNLDETITKG